MSSVLPEKASEINRTVPALKSSLINTSDRASHLKVADSVIEDDGDGAIAVDPRGAYPVLLSIPALDAVGDRLFSTSHVELDAPTVATVSASGAAVVPLSIPEPSVLQSFVQETRQRLIVLAGGSVFWRLFVGSGAAILMGAVTLILLSPSEDRLLNDDETAAVASSPRPIAESPATQTGANHAKAERARIQLTVNDSPHAGPVPAEYDDPFTAANLVSVKVNHAIHLDDQSGAPDRTVIQPVSHSPTVLAQPAWLSGTIDIEDGAEPVPSKRKYERSRPSNR